MRLPLLLVVAGLAVTLYVGESYWALIIGWVALGLVACLNDQTARKSNPQWPEKPPPEVRGSAPQEIAAPLQLPAPDPDQKIDTLH